MLAGLQSSNGTYVNYNKITPDTYHDLNDNDIIGLCIPGDEPVCEVFFVFKLIKNSKILENNDESIDIDDKRIGSENKVFNDDDDDDDDDMLFTQSDN